MDCESGQLRPSWAASTFCRRNRDAVRNGCASIDGFFLCLSPSLAVFICAGGRKADTGVLMDECTHLGHILAFKST